MLASLNRIDRQVAQLDRWLAPTSPAAQRRVHHLPSQPTNGTEQSAAEWVAPATCEEFFRDNLKLDITVAQWVLVKVLFDRVDPVDLTPTDRALAALMFGDCDRINPAARHTVAMLKGARVGGTWLWSLYLLYRAITADLSRLAAGEVAFCPIVCERMRLGRQTINYVRGALLVAGIDSFRTNNATDSVALMRPDGGRVTIEVFAASAGGASVRGKSFVAALLDEACFFRSAESGIVNDDEIYRAVSPRVMSGGTLGIISTAWAEEGLLWDLVKRNLGTPGGELNAKHETALACITPTEILRNDDKIKADIATARTIDPESAAREFDCIPLAQNTSKFFALPELRHAETLGVDLESHITPHGAEVGCGLDTGLVNDSSALVAVHLEDEVFTVACVLERRPTPAEPLKLSEVCKAYSEELARQHCYRATADVHEFEASKEYLPDIELIPAPTGLAGKQEAYTLLRTIIREKKLRLPPGNEKLIKQLSEVVAKPADGGKLRIWSPRTRGGHGDLVSALVNAVWQLHQDSGGLLSALDYLVSQDHHAIA